MYKQYEHTSNYIIPDNRGIAYVLDWVSIREAGWRWLKCILLAYFRAMLMVVTV